jgi:hypothetical protein
MIIKRRRVLIIPLLHFRRAGIGTQSTVKRQALIAKVSQDAATEIRHWQFSKARIKYNVTKARLSWQTKIPNELGIQVKQRMQNHLPTNIVHVLAVVYLCQWGWSPDWIDDQLCTDFVTSTNSSYVAHISCHRITSACFDVTHSLTRTFYYNAVLQLCKSPAELEPELSPQEPPDNVQKEGNAISASTIMSSPLELCPVCPSIVTQSGSEIADATVEPLPDVNGKEKKAPSNPKAAGPLPHPPGLNPLRQIPNIMEGLFRTLNFLPWEV